MSNKEYEELIWAIGDFLKKEEEVFGPFHMPEVSGRKPETGKEQPLVSNKKETASDKEQILVSGKEEAAADNRQEPVSDKKESGRSNTAPPELNEVRTLDELQNLCRASDSLHTDLKNTNLVFGTGNPNANIMFIGEAPGSREDELGEPFVGKAGQLLNKILAAISFQREDVYIANILKHRPPNNRDPLPEERRRSLPFLFRQIELIRPQFIVCLGRVSAQTLLDTNQPMKSLRGTFHPFQNGIELMVTFHPAALLRNPAWKRNTWEDVKMLRKRYDERNQNKS